jgi:transcriptional regulator with XRE-family HTH domain
MQLVDHLSTVLKENGVSVLKFSNETGISAYKIYKWFDGKGNPKHEDVKKVEEWLRVFRQEPEPDMKYKSPNLSEDVKIVESVEDRLIAELKSIIVKQDAEITWLRKQVERLISMPINSEQIS